VLLVAIALRHRDAAYIQRPRIHTDRTDDEQNGPSEDLNRTGPTISLANARSRGESYESVRRGTAWLSECAIFGLDTTIMDAETAHAVKANLAAVATHSVLYGDNELSNEVESHHTIFGPDGVLWSVMEVFASDPEQEKRLYGIQSLSVVAMHQPMNIAEIFDRSSTLGGEDFNNTAE
jgi:hypothetical protein